MAAAQQADDLVEWLDALQLSKRKSSFLKNIPASMADGVLVAEVISIVFPKIIQVKQSFLFDLLTLFLLLLLAS
jgi:hypothetical protein